MNLKEIRKWFIQESGRFDLVLDTVDYENNGADRYINAGQRLLDRMQTTPKTMGRVFQVVEVGTYTAIFATSRGIKEVWVVPTLDTTVGRTRLVKKDMSWIRVNYPNMNELTNGVPLYYAPGVFRAAPEPAATGDDVDAPMNYMDIIPANNALYNGIVFMPPVDQQYLIEVWGYFSAQELVNNADTSTWSLNFPELLVMSAQCELEMFARNTEGVKDWINAMTTTTKLIDFDLVEEETADVDQMEG